MVLHFEGVGVGGRGVRCGVSLLPCSLLVQKGHTKQEVNRRIQERGQNEVEDIYGSIYGVLDDPNEV